MNIEPSCYLCTASLLIAIVLVKLIGECIERRAVNDPYDKKRKDE